MAGVYYNEIDPYAAQWLRNLIAAGHIAEGDVDERSIVDVRPDDLRGYTQCHFFAGIGGWSLALRLANWPDDCQVWTGSCPCQPFSVGGKRKGHEDKRHLWPTWFRLIKECRPAEIFGEQVANAVSWGWLDEVFVSLEQIDYACGAGDFPACSVGADHIRQRLYWCAADTSAFDGHAHDRVDKSRNWATSPSTRRLAGLVLSGQRWKTTEGIATRPILVRNHHGVSSVLAGFGNAIVPNQAAEFINAYRECRP